MKKIILLVVSLGIYLISISQTLQLKSNGFQLNFKQIDTLFYYEFPTTSLTKRNAKSNDFNSVPLKYSFGTISKTKNNNPQEIPLYSSAFYAYEDGTLEAPTTQLFFKPINLSGFIKKYKYLGIIEKHPSLEGYYFLFVSDSNHQTGESILSLCNELYSKKDVSIIEPVFIRLLKTKNPLRPFEWNIRNNANVPGGVVGADMGVENAWNSNITGNGIRVAVIDDGVDLTHPDLQANLLPGFDATGNNSGGAPVANNGHGTNCAGIIASVNNTIGTIGVAFNSNIIPIRMGIVTFDVFGNGVFNTNDTWIANCFAEAVNRGADVISNSWGGGSPSAQINTAIQNAVTNGRNGRGCIVLFAAGNRNAAVDYPASNGNVIAVGASTPCDSRKRSSNDPGQVNEGVSTDPEGTSCDGEFWWGSNFGINLDVLAPGVWISTTDNVGGNGFVTGDYNDHFNGTSAGCPNAASVVALILAANPNLTGQEARNILEQTCFKIPNGNFQSNVAGQPNGTWSNQAGYGRIDACNAVWRTISANLDVSGDNVFCATSNSYSIPNLPAGATITWSVTPLGIVTINSPNAAQTTLTRNANGNVTLTATITYLCGNPILVSKTNIQAGTPQYSYEIVPSPISSYTECYKLNKTYSFTIQPTGTDHYYPNGPYQWYCTSSGILPSTTKTASLKFTSPGDYTLTVRPKNACGLGPISVYSETLHASSSCSGGYYLVSPNPVGNNLNVETIELNNHNNQSTAKNKSIIGFDRIEVFRKTGNLVLRKTYPQNSKKVNIDVSTLPSDVYVVRIFNGNISEEHKIIVQH